MLQSLAKPLRKRQHPVIQQLSHNIEALWNQHLSLSPYRIPEDLGYIEGHLEREKLTIENICYKTPQFRKLHLELAQVGDVLDILHCVMFPHPDYPLPVYGVDVVVGRGTISAAIVDLSPIHSDRKLPKAYGQPMADLPLYEFSQIRSLPPWGHIFSDNCVFIRPTSDLEQRHFLKYALNLLNLHCTIAQQSQPTVSATEKSEIWEGHKRYCEHQQKNDKTRRVLVNAFGEAWAERYMSTMLFDYQAA